MTISVYGSTGFIGSRYCELNPIETRIERNVLASETNDILYLISTVDNYNVLSNPYIDVETNLIHMIRVLEANKTKFGNDFTINFASSWFVYGKTGHLPAKETDLCNPTGFYSVTKLAAEKILISYCQTFGIKYRILRFANVLGVGDRGVSEKKNATTYFIRKIVNGEPIAIYNPSSKRDFIHIDDLCFAISLVSKIGEVNSIYNIGNGAPYVVRDLWEYVMDRVNYDRSKISYKVSQLHKIVQGLDMWLDIRKLLSLGYKRQWGINETIDQLIEEAYVQNK
jgi:nucleoside-diphosphate-sugar epimerase